MGESQFLWLPISYSFSSTIPSRGLRPGSRSVGLFFLFPLIQLKFFPSVPPREVMSVSDLCSSQSPGRSSCHTHGSRAHSHACLFIPFVLASSRPWYRRSSPTWQPAQAFPSAPSFCYVTSINQSINLSLHTHTHIHTHTSYSLL